MLRHCCCIVNVTLFSHVTLIRKLQLTSDLDHFHASDLPCSLVKSHDDPISDCLVDRQLPVPLYIYIDYSGSIFVLMASAFVCRSLNAVG